MTAGQTASLVSSVEQALQNLYDPDELQKSPLIEVLGLTPERGASPLRQLLVRSDRDSQTAGAGRPNRERPGEPTGCSIRHYVGQLSRSEVAEDLGLSIRQVVREDDRAVHLLSDYLRHRYNLDSATVAASLPLAQSRPATAGSTAPTRDQELQWLEASRPMEHVSIAEANTGSAHDDWPPLDRSSNYNRGRGERGTAACARAGRHPAPDTHQRACRQHLCRSRRPNRNYG